MNARAANGGTDQAANVAEFFKRVVPWPAENEPGYINLQWKSPKLDHGFGGRPYRTLVDFMEGIERAKNNPAYVQDIYFCLSRQSETKVIQGRMYALRRKLNATAMKCIALDADVKEKGYASTTEALQAVVKFCKDASLPPPTALVHSGGGLHVYWISDRALSMEEWASYATGLHGLAKLHGLRFDANVTIDCARVLRVPDTFNLKEKIPRPVKLKYLAKTDYNFEQDLGHIRSSDAARHHVERVTSSASTWDSVKLPPRPQSFALFTAEYQAEIGSVFQTEKLDPRIIGKCPLFREAMRTGGEYHNQGLWMLTGLACTFMENGRTAFHALSKGHSHYTPGETDEMFDRKMTEREEQEFGWPSCKALKDMGGKECETCPHWGKIKSPLNLTVPALPPVTPVELQVSFSNIPHRRWLYGVDLVRGDITVIGSPGGAGKTSLALGMAVSIATARPLLLRDSEKIFGENLKVLYINAEDSSVEMKRRSWALCLKHGIAEQDLNRLYLAGTDNPQVQHLSFLRTIDKNSSVLDQTGFQQLENLIVSLRPSLVVLDPLIALCGGGNVNDNPTMSLVMLELKRLAIKYDCAVLIVHHTRKGGDTTVADAISGASSIVNLSRRAIMPVTMTDDEAAKYNILPSEQFRFFKVIDAKSNLAPRSGDTPWYELYNTELPNAEPPLYMNGDRVQALTRVNLQEGTTTHIDPNIQKALLDTIHRGVMIDGQRYPYSATISGARNERALFDDAMKVVRDKMGSRKWRSGDLEAITKRAIRDMHSALWLIVADLKDLMQEPGRFRKGRGLRVDWARTPWSDAGAESGAAE